MKDLLAGKKIEDFEKALFSDDKRDWSDPQHYLGFIGDVYYSISCVGTVIRWNHMKPLPKQTPLTDLEIKEALVGVVVEARSNSGLIHNGVLGFLDDGFNHPWNVCGGWFETEKLLKFKNPTTRKMEPITRENLINAGLLND